MTDQQLYYLELFQAIHWMREYDTMHQVMHLEEGRKYYEDAIFHAPVNCRYSLGRVYREFKKRERALGRKL